MDKWMHWLASTATGSEMELTGEVGNDAGPSLTDNALVVRLTRHPSLVVFGCSISVLEMPMSYQLPTSRAAGNRWRSAATLWGLA